MAAYDRKALDALRRDLGDGTVGELIDLFLSDSEQQLTDLRAAADAGDLPAGTRVAHTLKSTSLALGAEDLARLCAQIEQLGRDGKRPAFGRKVEQTAKQFAQAARILARERAKLSD